MDDCRLCGGKDMELVLDMGEHPIAHHYKEDPAQEEYRHIVGLSFCKQCGHIQLDDPIPAEILYANYICLSSWKFQPHVPQLVNLISRQTSVTKDSLVLEVGSNDGRFLKALEEEGYRNLIGIEPAEDARRSAAEKGVITIPGFFDKQKAWGFVQEHGQCDLFISRQVLEHIKDLNEFMEAMRIVIKPGGLVLIEVPNFMMNLEMFDYTLWEEHVNYFTFDTLNNFFSRTGIVELHREKVVFSGEILVVLGQYIGPEAKETKIDYV
ncbi:MAG: methyltransferase domain-containing protein, partial [Candidatus Omnitrophica bacterium]|nr:methyltransferase domain-containing protein [Candidatus Omnitrophota bacterium]